VNKLRKSDASTNEIYKSIAPLFSTEDWFLRHAVEIRDTKDSLVSKIYIYVACDRFSDLNEYKTMNS
jgi:hypothetical protein